ncbi:unnamed protein product [Lota lota]
MRPGIYIARRIRSRTWAPCRVFPGAVKPSGVLCVQQQILRRADEPGPQPEEAGLDHGGSRETKAVLEGRCWCRGPRLV